MPTSLQSRLRQGDFLAGSWLNAGSPVAAEIAAQAGFDWLLIDREHGSGHDSEMAQQIVAVEGAGCAPVVRVSAIDPAECKRILDLGPAGIMAPCIDTVAQAHRIVECVRLSPLGLRQTATSTRAVRYGRSYSHYVAHNNEELLLIVQIESREAVANAAAIAAVPGVDLLFVGPTDLASSLGLEPDPQIPEFRQALETVVASCPSAGILARNEAQARLYRQMGFQCIAMASDRGILAAGFDRAAAALRDLR